MSISVPIGPRTDGGASSLRNSPIAIESGAAMRTAPKAVIIVPRMNCKAPKCRWTGSQVLVQTKPMPNCRIAGHEPSISFQTIAAIRSSVARQASAVSAARTRSPIRS